MDRCERSTTTRRNGKDGRTPRNVNSTNNITQTKCQYGEVVRGLPEFIGVSATPSVEDVNHEQSKSSDLFERSSGRLGCGDRTAGPCAKAPRLSLCHGTSRYPARDLGGSFRT